ncbi:MAG: STAS domain-containing protein [Halanaerobiaceae bacterium]
MNIKKEENRALIKPGERVDFNNAHEFKEGLMSILGDYEEIIIDFEGVKSIDSAGLGKILMFQKRVKENDGSLKIINVESDYVRKMFKMIHLNKIIAIEGF